MASFKIDIKAIVSCVPCNKEENILLDFSNEELNKIIENTGIKSRRIVSIGTTAADLCTASAKEIIENKIVEKEEIGVLIFVTQYPDYILPSTVHVLQDKLGLSQDTLCFQVNEGCAGYIYGVYLGASLLKTSEKNSALILVGDTTSKIVDENDQSTRPLFGDAGSATLIQKSAVSSINIQLGSDGSGEKDIKVNHGGFRNGFDEKPKLHMDGMNVFMFGISRVPKFILQFMEENNLVPSIFNYTVLHQANKMMNDRIVRKLGFEDHQSLSSLENFGNTSNASIPLTITMNLEKKKTEDKRILACGFGVGLAWGVMDFVLPRDCYLATIEYY